MHPLFGFIMFVTLLASPVFWYFFLSFILPIVLKNQFGSIARMFIFGREPTRASFLPEPLRTYSVAFRKSWLFISRRIQSYSTRYVVNTGCNKKHENNPFMSVLWTLCPEMYPLRDGFFCPISCMLLLLALFMCVDFAVYNLLIKCGIWCYWLNAGFDSIFFYGAL